MRLLANAPRKTAKVTLLFFFIFVYLYYKGLKNSYAVWYLI